MMKKKLVHNVETGQVMEVELSEEDIAQRAIDDETIKAEKAAKALEISAKEAILNRLGLTAEEAALLLS